MLDKVIRIEGRALILGLRNAKKETVWASAIDLSGVKQFSMGNTPGSPGKAKAKKKKTPFRTDKGVSYIDCTFDVDPSTRDRIIGVVAGHFTSRKETTPPVKKVTCLPLVE